MLYSYITGQAEGTWEPRVKKEAGGIDRIEWWSLTPRCALLPELGNANIDSFDE